MKRCRMKLNRMGQEAAFEAHGLHIANPKELDGPILVNVVPFSSIELPEVVFGGYQGKGVVPEPQKQAEKRPNTAPSIPLKKTRQSTSTDQLRNTVHIDVLKNKRDSLRESKQAKKERKEVSKQKHSIIYGDTDNLWV